MNRDSLLDLRERAEERLKKPSIDDVSALSREEISELLHNLHVHQAELEMQNEELRYTQQVLLTARDKYSKLYDIAPVGYCTLDDKGIVRECNLAFCKMLNLGRDKILRKPLGSFVEALDLPVFNNLFRQRKNEAENKIRLKSRDKKAIHVLMRVRHINDNESDAEAQKLVTVSDVTRLHEMSIELKIKGRAIETTMEGVMISDHNNQIFYTNPAFEETTGYKHEDVVGKNPGLLKSGKHTESFYKDMWSTIKKTGRWRGEIWNRRANGEIFPEWLSISTIFDDRHQPIYYVAVFSDITREESIRKRLHQLAYYDGLTNLPNRHLFQDRLKQEIAHARRNNTSFALLFMDLDRFKTINDTLGHATGDHLLVKVSERLKTLLRDMDTISRMGGDEFMILLPSIDSSNDAVKVAQKILGCMQNPFDLAGRQYHVSISIGISSYPLDGLDAESLIKHADIAMYKAKDKGRNTVQLYDVKLNEKINNELSLENELRKALSDDLFFLDYQPQIDSVTKQITGVEALIRWKHPTKGVIFPTEFIHIAEETGLIVDIGYWVLRSAANQYQKWIKRGVDIGLMSVNLSPHQFLQSNLIDNIKLILSETEMPADKLCIEITESAAMPNIEYSVQTLQALRKEGISISIDDFGSGFSSLSSLRKLPIDALKIDRQFIDEIPSNPDDVAITKAIIAMAQTLNLNIIAEGVENESQFDFIKKHGGHEVQGYYICKPASPIEIEKWVSNH